MGFAGPRRTARVSLTLCNICLELSDECSLLFEELGWGKDKVDDLLVPIIQKARKRGQVSIISIYLPTGSEMNT